MGPVDQEMVFYLRSRGLSRAEAERLIVEGFFRTVLQRLDAPEIVDRAWRSIEQTLARGGTTA